MDLNLSDKRVLVAGLGISGNSAVEVLRGKARSVTSVDERQAAADVHSFNDIDWSQVDLLVVSPVFNPRSSFIRIAQERKIPIVSEVEVGWQLRVANARTGYPAPWIGITGTNGKTSTTQMTAAIMGAAGLNAPAVGNIGLAVSEAAVDSSCDVLCVELSSFQLHYTQSLELECAAITNLAADHLDWHGSFEAYVADKAKIYSNVRKALVYNADDEKVSALATAVSVATTCRKVGFTLETPKAGQIGVEQGWIVDRSGIAGGFVDEPKQILPLGKLHGLSEPNGQLYPHLLADALCALALALGAGAQLDAACEAMEAFRPGGHRIETVAQLGVGEQVVRFVDDSKATNAHAAQASLSSYEPNSVIWIAGGQAKSSQFDQLVASQVSRLVAVVVIGVDQEPILEALSRQAPHVPYTRIASEPVDTIMQRTVAAAASYARPGRVVLLAPACASLDQFSSYAQRGQLFAQAARDWVDEHENC